MWFSRTDIVRPLFGLYAVVAVSLATVPTWTAEAAEGAAPAKPVLEVQLDWFMVPVTTKASNKTRTVPATIFFRAAAPEDVAPICVFEPRLRDAMLRVLFEHPIEVSKGQMMTRAVRPALVEAVNGVMKQKRVADVWVVSGIARAARGDLKNLPFDQVQSCRDVREGEQKLYEQKLKQQSN